MGVTDFLNGAYGLLRGTYYTVRDTAQTLVAGTSNVLEPVFGKNNFISSTINYANKYLPAIAFGVALYAAPLFSFWGIAATYAVAEEYIFTPAAIKKQGNLEQRVKST